VNKKRLLPRWTTERKLYKKRQRKKELLFVNKKKQKNFVNFWPVAVQRPREAEQKFFGSFFKKELLESTYFSTFHG
jgi:hypothetical protein